MKNLLEIIEEVENKIGANALNNLFTESELDEMGKHPFEAIIELHKELYN